MSRLYYVILLLASFIAITSAQDSPFAIECRQHTSCGDCVAVSSCLWCSETNQCLAGGFFGPEIKDSCPLKGSHYKTCGISIMIYLILIGVGGGLVFLAILAILCKCLCCSGGRCCRRSRKAVAEMDHYVPLTAEDPNSTPKTDEKRRQLEAKYGRSFGSVSKNM